MDVSDHPLEKIRFGLMVAIGGEDPTATLAEIAAQRVVIDREIREVPERAKSLGEEFWESSAPVREALMDNLSRYSRWLDKAATALKDEDTAASMELHDESQDLLPQLTDALEKYSRAFASFGPFDSAMANSLWRLAAGIREGALVPTTWPEYLAYFQGEVAIKVKALTQLDLPGRTYLLENYSDALKALNMLNGEGWKDGLQEILERLDGKLSPAESLEQVLARGAAGEATRIPATNVLLAVMRAPEGSVDESQIMSVLDDYNEIVEGYLQTFEQAVARPTHSDLIREEIPRTLDTIDDHFLLIENLNDLLEDESVEQMEQLLQKIEDSANRLIDSRQVYEVAALHQAHKACPACARSNPPENQYCEACGQELPQADKTGRPASSTFSVMSGPISEENRAAEMTENVARLFQACDDVAVAKISKDEFGQELQLAVDNLKEFMGQYENMVNIALDQSLFSPEEWESWRANHLPHLEDLAISYYAGIEDLRAGLVSMETFLSEPKDTHLIEGIRLYWQGIQAIHRGKLGLEAHTKMLDDLMRQG